MNAMWTKYAEVIPNLEGCIDTGSIYLDSFSMEKLIDAKPDLVILAPYQAKKLGDGINTIKNLGIPIAVVDYNSFTLEKHIKSTEILGKLLGTEERAKELIENYKKQTEDVENKLKEVQYRNARVEVKEDKAIEKGDIAVIDFKGFTDDVAFEGGEGTDYELEIGSGTFIDNFEEQLIGLKAGDFKEVNVTFPEQYGREELNGKPAKFEVKIKTVKVKELPAIDDEFAKEVSEFETLEEYRNDIKANLEEANEIRVKKEYEEAVINAAVANAKIDIPEVMINREIDGMLKDLETRLQYQGLDIQTYYQFTNTSEESFRQQMKEVATNKVKTEVVMDKIAEVENITATEEEVKAKAKEMAEMYYGASEADKTAELLMNSQKEYLQLQVTTERVKDMLVESSKAI
ncbi:MAG TPA: trigger factor [Clostridium sp.]|nr:trigger factor [Clostridium sp.]